MGSIIEVITGRATNPAAFTALTMNTGDTNAVRSFGDMVACKLCNLWSQQATAGYVRARSSRMHDPTRGITMATFAAANGDLLPDEVTQLVYPTDTITLEIQGGAAEVDAMAVAMAYDGLSSKAAELTMWEQVKPLIKDYVGHQVAVTGPVTSGDWSAGNALNSLSGLLHANTWYAVLGYTLDAPVLSVAVQGPDTANYKAGGPGPQDVNVTRDWFIRWARADGQPRIPVINSQNQAATNVHIARITAAGTVNVTLLLAELTAKPA